MSGNLVWYMLDIGPNAGALRPAIICDSVTYPNSANLVVFTLGQNVDGAVWYKSATPVMGAERVVGELGEEYWKGGTRG
jgi:hypothetical protein